jgi:hypothetical protein
MQRGQGRFLIACIWTDFRLVIDRPHFISEIVIADLTRLRGVYANWCS